MTCPTCGAANREGARFCDTCGAALEAAPPPREVRKTVTVLFCDVAGSTALGERLDPEATRKLMGRYFEQARTILERHGASVEKFIGDAVMAVFGIPQVHEDDALRAARAALELRDAVTELELRIGVNTGEVVTGTGETLVTGDPVNVAARLEGAAQPGEILIGDATYRLVRDAVDVEPVEPVEAKGKTDPVAAHRLLGVREGADSFARRLEAPLVGREEELTQLRQVFARSMRDASCHLFTLLGPPGIGKSRLAQEFVAALPGKAIVVSGRCLSYGEGITYWPLVELLRDVGGTAGVAQMLEREPDARAIINTVAAGVGLADGASRPEETSRGVRRLFEAIAREGPLVVVLDDLHWAEPTFLDLVEHVADLSRDAPILLLCLARSDLLDSRPSWSGGKHNATTLLLEPLSEDEAETLIANLLAGTGLDDSTRRRISAAAEGNPLFVEQMLAMLTEDGLPDGSVAVPPTIQALLAARLDRLDPDERGLLERASIVGKEFWAGAVADLGAETSALSALVRKELVRPHRSLLFPGDDAYRFRHQLVRDAAYDAISKELRAELHERFADWLQGRLSEYDEIVGYHLEQAFRYRAEVGPTDDQARRLALRAGHLLAAAGVRASERGDIGATIGLLTRAAELFPGDDERRADLLCDLAYGHFEAGELEPAGRLFTEAAERAAAAEQPAAASRAAVGRLCVETVTGKSMRRARDVLQREIATLEKLDAPAALAEAYREAGKVEGWLGSTEAGDRYYEHALTNARRSRNRRIETDVLSWRIMMQCWGYLPAREGLRSTTAVLAGHAGGRMEAFTRVAHALYRSMRGDVEAARREIGQAIALMEELGVSLHRTGALMQQGYIELEAGRPAAAEAALREGVATLEQMGERGYLSTMAALLARAQYQQGKLDEAAHYTNVSAEAAAADDALTQLVWRATRAKVLARSGDIGSAEPLAREAVELARKTDYLLEHAECLLDLAEVLELAGRRDEARGAVEDAIVLFDRKEAVLAGQRARQRLHELVEEPLADRD